MFRDKTDKEIENYVEWFCIIVALTIVIYMN